MASHLEKNPRGQRRAFLGEWEGWWDLICTDKQEIAELDYY